jgi:cytoskeletal protein RodZ
VAKKNPKDIERRAMVEKMRQDQARKERLRSLSILGVSVAVVVAILGVAVWQYVADQRDQTKLASTAISKIGVSQSAAACNPIETKPTDKNQNHIPEGTPITYKDAPPAFGEHRPQPAAFGRPFYTAADRPEVATLVHNEEHGYTIAWYDATAAKDKNEMDNLEAIAKQYQDDKVRFVAAPWTSADGAAFPSGKHVALTRWSADAGDPSDQAKQRGNWQYCGATSGAVISDFVKKWSNKESPEPGIM